MEGRKRPAADGFDFTAHIRRLCADMVCRLPELSHIELSRVAIRCCQVRRSGHHGVQATLTPLRFEGGATELVKRGRRWRVQRIVGADGQEMLYLLSFYLPRFLNLPGDEKLATVLHELWHIGPQFDGDLRRHPGRCYAHGTSEERFHQAMREMAHRWLALKPPTQLYEFTRYDFRQLQAVYGRVYGTRIPTPKLIPVRDAQQRPMAG